jgi:hypothetical protein
MMFSRAFCLALLAAACVSLPYAFASEQNTVALIAGDDQVCRARLAILPALKVGRTKIIPYTYKAYSVLHV